MQMRALEVGKVPNLAIPWLLFFSIYLFVVPVSTIAAELRGLGQHPAPRGPEIPTVLTESFSASHALVVGIDRYSDGWPRLHNAVQDAELIRQALQERGFTVTLLTDPTADRLRRALVDFFGGQGHDPNARLLFWYAGHGETVDGDGYLVPADVPVTGHPAFRLRALSMHMYESILRLARAKHVLSVFDACFAGTIFRTRGLPQRASALQRKLHFPVRQFLTSGDAGQQVRDDGTFRTLFIRALDEDSPADVNLDNFLTGEELGLYLSHELTVQTRAAQTPQFGRLLDPAYDRGDFVFALPQSHKPAESSLGCNADLELTFWQTVKQSDKPEEYALFLERFPQCTFSALARHRLELLRQSTAVEDPVPSTQKTTAAVDGTWQGYGGSLSTQGFGSEPWAGQCNSLNFDLQVNDGALTGTVYSAGEILTIQAGSVDAAGKLHDAAARGALILELRGHIDRGHWKLLDYRKQSRAVEVCSGKYSLKKSADRAVLVK